MPTKPFRPRNFKVTLRGAPWTIKFVAVTDEDDPDCLGITISEQTLIMVRKDLEPHMLRNVVLHELCHAFLDVFDDEKLNEEIICNVVAAGMLEVAPQLPRWVLKG